MKRLTTEEFIEKARKVHGDKYDYKLVNYQNATTKVIIICPEHGIFEQRPGLHLQGNGCPKCAKKLKYYGIEDFIYKANKIHNNKYNYSKVVYTGTRNLVTIICPIHGEFQQKPCNHLQGKGCPKCKNDKLHTIFSFDTQTFIQKAKLIHGDRYDYSKVNYFNSRTKVCIICPEHGEFWQIPSDHLNGHGCPKCITHHSNGGLLSQGEKQIKNFLDNKNINYSLQYPINIAKDINQSGIAYIDFYLPDYNLFIEYNGIQHYMPVKYFGGKITFEHQQKRDQYIKDYCKKNNIDLLEIKYSNDINESLSRKLKF